ncbi:MAG: response regulator transcription factor [Campylobacterota bacterium]|nr:response regulator transcription factor [Campylobacterota bacterium]
MINVLMIEDDNELAEIITRYLFSYDIKISNADSALLGLSTLETGSYELLILDLTLPDMDGLELLNKIRQRSSIPVIISSARDDILDKVIGLERGADDYLPKPYNPRELEARIKSILRRSATVQKDVQSPEIFIHDKRKGQIFFMNRILELTLAEFDILALLIQKINTVVSREEMIYTSNHIDDDSTLKNIDVMISRIRQKIKAFDDSTKYIKSVRSIGYILIS